METVSLFPDVREAADTQLRQAQLVMLRLLKIFDYICNKHSIQYFLTGGTLIGAVRHQGFIPWDDDLDIGMSRANYEKFVEYGLPELPADVFFQSETSDPDFPSCNYVEAKLRDRYSSYTINKFQYHDGIQLDIFVYDRAFLPANLLIIIQNMLLKAVCKTYRRRSAFLKKVFKVLPPMIPLVYSSSYLHKFGMMNKGTYVKDNEISDLIRVPFEDVLAPVPVNYHNYLRRQYGDYMKLPPPNKRHCHHESLPQPFVPCEHKESLDWCARN